MDFLIATGIRILEFLFFAGWIGSLLVILLTGIEDIETAFSNDDGSHSSQVTP
ncbi:MAG: hypothetical protein ACXVZV_03100 [Terriglobales bacterium]